MITVQDLEFTYAGATTSAVRGLDFEVHPGEIFGFLGPSGAGKSTTQRILSGLLKPYRGLVLIFDRELSDWDGDFYERIGVSFELPNHFLKLTGIENLEYFRALYQSTTVAPAVLLESVGLGDSGGVRVGQYSKGMMTRLGVARALLHGPELVFMDEPTVGLDPTSGRLVKEVIRAQRDQGKTIFLTTHDMATVDELCDRVAFIVGGEIKLIDRPRELKLSHGTDQVVIEYQGRGGLARQSFPLSGLGTNQAFLDLLRTHPIQTIHTQEASLDDIFIRVTGERLA
ncbi:MAG: ABC transporter ATP-binding protein [Gemmatimonadales bacterium]|nr:ABC transporter ATP-binding protein [Gemmatimonadales bacterium]